MSQTKITSKSTFNSIIDDIKNQCSGNWPDHVIEMEKFIRAKCDQYAAALYLPPLDVLKLMEKKRSYNACNYYQEHTFPALGEVRVFDQISDLMKSLVERRFRCPHCKQESTDPYECNSGHKMQDGKPCNWKSYGLFRTMGKGVRIAVKSTFNERGIVIDEIFMPIAWENQTEGVQP